MAAPAVTVFVYFKVARSIPDQAVHTALDRLAALLGADDESMASMRRVEPGLRAPAAEARPAESTGPAEPIASTWMTVHRGVDPESLPRWLAGLEQAAIRSGLSALISGGRHVEVFEAAVRHR